MINADEHVNRIKLLQKKTGEQQLDAFLVTDQESIYYLTGASYIPFERPFVVIAWPEDPPTLLVPIMEEKHLADKPGIGEIITYWDYPSKSGENWFDRLKEILGKSSFIGVEPSMIMELHNQLQNYQVKTIPLIEEMRMIKSPTEIQMLRTASHYSDMGMAKILSDSYYGTTVLETFTHGRTIQTKLISETDFQPMASSVLTVALPAPFSGNPHGIPPIDARLNKGPHAAASVMRVNGYTSECERSYFHGEPDEKRKNAFRAMLDARESAFSLIRDGASCSDIDAAANGFLKEQGYGDFLLHRTGHGLGQGNHEGPWISEGSNEILRENMVISVEPGIYMPDIGGFRHSDTVLVTKDGYECLTKYPVDIESLIIRPRKAFKKIKGKIIRKMAGIE